MQIGILTINRYYCRWVYSDRFHRTAKRKVLHAGSISEIKEKAIRLYGRIPDEIVLIG